MIGVVHYSGPCAVCEHPDASRITAALLAHAGALAVSEEYPDSTYRDVKQHERNCLPSGAANNQTNQRRTA